MNVIIHLSVMKEKLIYNSLMRLLCTPQDPMTQYGVSSSSSSSSSSATCQMLVHAYATSPGKVKQSGPQSRRWRQENELKSSSHLHSVLFHSVTHYTDSIV